ncbi:MAG: asparagine synthase (glutamine-hydrolyzing) [Phaeodactylibacter sp.]|nr:asparagine synthase (glutamine-hydrolyzing) [Phaeodactylibacter sp.]
MCGIFGLVNKNNAPVPPETTAGAARLLAHRGPDGEGTFHDGPLALAHRRLAIFDLSDKGRQPMRYRHYTVVFNGAIYNFQELREALRRHGYVFQTNTDTEVIPAAYDCWGEGCLHRFNGMWAFALYDHRERQLFCARDRFGIRPFYYLDDGQRFAFASEVKAFGAIPGRQFALNRVRAYEFLARGWQAHTEECLAEDIRQLPAGCCAAYRLDDRRLEIRRYYHLEEHLRQPEEKTFEDRKQRFRELLADSVRLRLRADAPLALSLSGGLDSSSVLAVQAALQPGAPLDCFSVVFPGTAADESPYVDAVAQQYRPALRKLTPSFESIMAGLEQACWFQDEPIASAAVVAHFRMMQAIREQGFKVMLNGQGADEILAGYDKFYWPFFRELARARPWKLPTEIAGLLRRSPPSLPDAWRRFRASRARPTAPGWLQPDFVPPPEQLFRRQRDEDVADCSRHLLREVGLPVLLQYEDRSAMANGVESRLPFMDHRLVEYCLSLPAGDKIRYGIRKYILRRAMQGQLPESILRRYGKLGFPTPQAEWMEQHPGVFLERLEAAVQQNPEIFAGALLPRAQAALERRERAFYPAIWRGVAFGAWARIGGVAG